MIKREANATSVWNNYCRKMGIYGSFELKQTGTDKFYFHAFEPHQIDSLLAIEEHGLVWKISDADARQKPADVISLPPSPAYVVIKYPGEFVMIRVQDFVNYMEKTQDTFINSAQAKEIATKVVWV